VISYEYLEAITMMDSTLDTTRVHMCDEVDTATLHMWDEVSC